jgi:cytosine/creatinine deaminase
MVNDVLITNVALPDGRVVALRTEDGLVSAMSSALEPLDGELVEDLTGYLLLPAGAEPHAHLDKALTADLIDNPTGDLMGAIIGWIGHRPSLTHDDIVSRARWAIGRSVLAGMTAIRTHVDVGADIGILGVEALVEVRESLRGIIDIQIVGLFGNLTDPAARAAAKAAIAAGIDVMGGCPHLEDDPDAVTRWCVETAAEARLPLDLHTDENLNVASLDLEVLADLLLNDASLAGALDHRVTASHCVSLGMQDAATQQRVAEKVAAANISVIALPHTNLFLQARDIDTATPRGLTALAALHRADVNVAAGADNLQDPFNTMGRADHLETAALMVMAGHLDPMSAYGAVSNRSRKAMGLAPIDYSPGSPADFLAMRASSVREAIASASPDRVVIAKGNIVARSALSAQLDLSA